MYPLIFSSTVKRIFCSKNLEYLIVGGLVIIMIIVGAILGSLKVSADDVTTVNAIINVPVACSMSGTVDVEHTTQMMNGNYQSGIGTTTLKAFCNDMDGFSIYVIGYTDNIEGKNVLTSASLGSENDIITGTATSGGSSNWAMKLETDINATYPITLQNEYNNYHVVPDDYELVATRTAQTDVGENATGASLTTTYQIYISASQPAGTYVGQVKYTLVHPHDGDAPVKGG